MEYIANGLWQKHLRDGELDDTIVAIRTQIEENLAKVQNRFCMSKVEDNLDVYDTSNYWKPLDADNSVIVKAFSRFADELHKCVYNEDANGFEAKKYVIERYMLLEERVKREMASI